MTDTRKDHKPSNASYVAHLSHLVLQTVMHGIGKLTCKVHCRARLLELERELR